MNKMESKEALKRIRREAGTPYFSTLYDIDMWKEDFKIIERDLEILEFIKEHIQYTEYGLWYLGMCESDFDFKCEMTKKEWDKSMQKKIKEWLKEED